MARSGVRRAPRVLVLALSLAAVVPARADVSVHAPDEVAGRWIAWTAEDAAALTFGGREWSLVTDPADPVLSTLGDGDFHPMSLLEVRAALNDLGPAGERAEGRILILPYPRRESLKSSCEDGTIFLSPGIREVHPAHVHATVAHEIGHLVQRRLAPEGSRAWSEYLALRGVTDAPAGEDTAHRDRPREIFAEDFRILRGGALAQGPHENGDLPDPRDVPGLDAWLERVLAAPAPGVDRPPETFPNPFSVSRSGELEIRFRGPGPPGAATAEVFDVAGRRVRTLRTSTRDAGGDRTFRWDGRDPDGSRAASGFYFVRWRENPSAGTARVQILH